jgi:hypothetical protein
MVALLSIFHFFHSFVSHMLQVENIPKSSLTSSLDSLPRHAVISYIATMTWYAMKQVTRDGGPVWFTLAVPLLTLVHDKYTNSFVFDILVPMMAARRVCPSSPSISAGP